MAGDDRSAANTRPNVHILRRDLAAAFRAAVRFGMHEGVCNHFSLAVDADRAFLLNPHGVHFSRLRASNLLLVDAEGRSVEGSEKRHTAFFIHARIHLANPRARCVLHAHPRNATALTMLRGGRLLPCHQNALRFHGRVAYYDEYDGLVLDEAEGDRIADALAGSTVLFMKHHGVIVTGPTVADALDDLYYLERAAEAQITAMSTGAELALVPEEIAAATAKQFERLNPVNAAMHFDELKRILDHEEPDYAN
ncbi:MAG TPA: aldolase [Alphaproteobacteria bacterium]|nr:aldolase [Alphaproteobacteria bacterium]